MKGFVIFFLDFRYNFSNMNIISKSFATYGCCHPCYYPFLPAMVCLIKVISESAQLKEELLRVQLATQVKFILFFTGILRNELLVT